MSYSKQERQSPFNKFKVKDNRTTNALKQVLRAEQHETSITIQTPKPTQVEADASAASFLKCKYLDSEYDIAQLLKSALDQMEESLKTECSTKDLLTSKINWQKAKNNTLNLVHEELTKSIQYYIDERLKELANIQDQTIEARINKESEVKAIEKLRRKIEYVLAEEKLLEQAEIVQEQAERRDKQMRDRWKYWFYIAGRLTNIIALLLLWGSVCFYSGRATSINTPKTVFCGNR